MPYANLLIDTAAGIRTITINRPDKLNALNRDTVTELRAAFDQAATDPRVRVVVLAGSKTAGPLQGDSSAVGIQRQLRAMMGTSSGASGVFGQPVLAGLHSVQAAMTEVVIAPATHDEAEQRDR